MPYEEATDAQTTVSRSEAQFEIEQHGCDFDEFLRDCGDKPEYKGAEVLGWLGY